MIDVEIGKHYRGIKHIYNSSSGPKPPNDFICCGESKHDTAEHAAPKESKNSVTPPGGQGSRCPEVDRTCRTVALPATSLRAEAIEYAY